MLPGSYQAWLRPAGYLGPTRYKAELRLLPSSNWACKRCTTWVAGRTKSACGPGRIAATRLIITEGVAKAVEPSRGTNSYRLLLPLRNRTVTE